MKFFLYMMVQQTPLEQQLQLLTRSIAAYLIFVILLRPVKGNQEVRKFVTKTKKLNWTKQAEVGQNIAFSMIKSTLP